jgi:predicted GIY-YIG superfamily endonuclease
VLTHKDGSPGSFNEKYCTKTLVWYEHHSSMDNAILRETQLKVWKRAWKIELIGSFNRDWIDLHKRIEYRPARPPKRGSISLTALQRLDGMTGVSEVGMRGIEVQGQLSVGAFEGDCSGLSAS